MQLRSTNFRLSQNDIILMTNNVFEEIAIECALDFIQQEVLIDKEVDEYDIEALYTQVGSEIAMDVMSIMDDKGWDVADYFIEIGRNKFKANLYINEEKTLLHTKTPPASPLKGFSTLEPYETREKQHDLFFISPDSISMK